MVKLIVADDHPLFRAALIQTLSMLSLDAAEIETSDFCKHTIIEAEDFDSTLIALDENHDTDLLLLDLNMPGSDGLLGLVRIRKIFPAVPVIVISASEQKDIVLRVMSFGASGFIPKSAKPVQIADALKAVIAGDMWFPRISEQEALEDSETITSSENKLVKLLAELTPQQYKVLSNLTEGLLNKQIAHGMGITEATVKAHATAIFRKLGVNNRTQVVILTQHLKLKVHQG